MAASPELTTEQVEAFLAEHHGAAVDELTPLGGGYWSSAFSYRVAGRELVARFGSMREGYDMDRDAMAYSSSDLPVPEVLAVGEAFGAFFAISVRHHGRFLEDLAVEDAEAGGATLTRLLTALRTAPPGPPEPSAGWRQWLLDGLVDDIAVWRPSTDAGQTVSGWRARLAGDPRPERIFRAAEAAVRGLLPRCPERRDLVHGDLLHQNVLITDDASEVTAVFSWKCSARGDFLFDTAWCTFWSAWFPGIAATEMWNRVADVAGPDPDALVDAAARHHCYELQIGASHLGWYAWTDDAENLARCADHVEQILWRGPLTLPA